VAIINLDETEPDGQYTWGPGDTVNCHANGTHLTGNVRIRPPLTLNGRLWGHYSRAVVAQDGFMQIQRLSAGDDPTLDIDTVIVDMNSLGDYQGVIVGMSDAGYVSGAWDKLAIFNQDESTDPPHFIHGLYCQFMQDFTFDEVYIKDSQGGWGIHMFTSETSPPQDQTLDNVTFNKVKLVNCYGGVVFWDESVTDNTISNIAFDTIGPAEDGCFVTQAGGATGNLIGTWSKTNKVGSNPDFFTNTTSLNGTEGSPTLPQDLIDLVEGVSDTPPFPPTSYDEEIAELWDALTPLTGRVGSLEKQMQAAKTAISALQARPVPDREAARLGELRAALATFPQRGNAKQLADLIRNTIRV
jgi:hypothetical protein